MPDISQLATKTDLEQLRIATKVDLDQLRIATKGDLDTLDAKTDAKIAAANSKLMYLIVGAAGLTVISQWAQHFVR